MSTLFSRILEDIDCVFDRDPAARNRLEIITAYPGVHAVLLHRLNHWLWSMGLKWLARFGSHLARLLTGVEIHPGAVIGRRLFIDHGMGVVVGETSEIGDDCTLYHGVTLGGTSWEKGKRHPTLENNVVVGAGAKVLGPITLHCGARVGSNAVVVKDIPAGATAVGIPGKIVGEPDEKQKARADMAEKIGFDAYGTSSDMPDPVTQALDSVLDHLNKVESELAELRAAAHAPAEKRAAND